MPIAMMEDVMESSKRVFVNNIIPKLMNAIIITILIVGSGSLNIDIRKAKPIEKSKLNSTFSKVIFL
jgi:hypothetical protein